MSVVIRLAKVGRRGNQVYRIVAIDKKRKRGAMPLEILGTHTPNQTTTLAKERLAFWQTKGAAISQAVRKLVAEK